MAVITITSVEDAMKRELRVACLTAGTDMSAELRRRLPRITAELGGDTVSAEDLEAALGDERRKVRELARAGELLRSEVERLKRLNSVQAYALGALPSRMTQPAIEQAQRRVRGEA